MAEIKAGYVIKGPKSKDPVRLTNSLMVVGDWVGVMESSPEAFQAELF